MLKRNSIQTTLTLCPPLKISGWLLFHMIFDQWSFGSPVCFLLVIVFERVLRTILKTVLRNGFKWRINLFAVNMLLMMIGRLKNNAFLFLNKYLRITNYSPRETSLDPNSLLFQFIPFMSVLLKMWRKAWHLEGLRNSNSEN